jgi:hypothetical protein
MRFTIKVAIQPVLLALIIWPGYALLLPQDDDSRAAFELLLKADVVYDQAVGIAGVRKKEYDAFETLWKAGKAAESYALELVRDGTPAARVYGAILLLEIDKAGANREFPSLKKETTTVRVQSGCIVRQETVGDLVRQLEMRKRVIFTPAGSGVRRK